MVAELLQAGWGPNTRNMVRLHCTRAAHPSIGVVLPETTAAKAAEQRTRLSFGEFLCDRAGWRDAVPSRCREVRQVCRPDARSRGGHPNDRLCAQGIVSREPAPSPVPAASLFHSWQLIAHGSTATCFSCTAPRPLVSVNATASPGRLTTHLASAPGSYSRG